jgi:hypothetical protein
LQDEGSGDLVDDAAVLLTLVASLVEDLVGFAGGEALVPPVDGQTGERAELCGKGLRFGGLGAELAGEVNGVAHHDAGDAEAAGQTGQRTKVLSGNAGRWATPLQGQHRLGGKAQLVGDSDADAAVADVETEIAGNWLQLPAPSFQLLALSFRLSA